MLTRNQFLIKEHVGLFKLTDTYDIFDPADGTKIGMAREKVSTGMQLLRLLINKQMLPTTVEILQDADDHGNGTLVIAIKRGFTLFRSKVRVIDGKGADIGYFKSKLFAWGGGFWLHDTAGTRIAEVKGDWRGWNFRLLDTSGKEMGTVTKQWAGLGKELFTSADNYMVAIAAGLEKDVGVKALLLAAGIAIDTIYKEQG